MRRGFPDEPATEPDNARMTHFRGTCSVRLAVWRDLLGERCPREAELLVATQRRQSSRRDYTSHGEDGGPAVGGAAGGLGGAATLGSIRGVRLTPDRPAR
jgi:hypothetical protein